MEDYDYKIITDVGTIVIFCIGFPLTLRALCALYCQVRNDHVAPIYVINLLIADMIQLCCMIVLVAPLQDHNIIALFFTFSALMVSVGFMVCIALERYLAVAHPLWNCLRRSIKTSVVACVLVWTLPLAIFFLSAFLDYYGVTGLILGVFFLLPLPLFIFFLSGTLKALSASVSVPSDEKRRTVGILILLLLIYMLHFLPSGILMLAGKETFDDTFRKVCVIFIQLRPLADLILYFFMRKGGTDTDGNKQYELVEIKK